MTEKQRVVTMTAVIQYDTVGPWKKKNAGIY